MVTNISRADFVANRIPKLIAEYFTYIGSRYMNLVNKNIYDLEDLYCMSNEEFEKFLTDNREAAAEDILVIRTYHDGNHVLRDRRTVSQYTWIKLDKYLKEQAYYDSTLVTQIAKENLHLEKPATHPLGYLQSVEFQQNGKILYRVETDFKDDYFKIWVVFDRICYPHSLTGFAYSTDPASKGTLMTTYCIDRMVYREARKILPEFGNCKS